MRYLRLFTPWDLLLLCGILAVGAYMSWSQAIAPQAGVQVAVVRRAGRAVDRFVLSPSLPARVVPVRVQGGTVRIEVAGGRVRVLPIPIALNPTGQCYRQGWISRPGEDLICLPNRLTVQIQGRGGIDATSG